ncbi:hypothetical protein Tsubulata_031407, partial [Turnera subulata]
MLTHCILRYLSHMRVFQIHYRLPSPAKRSLHCHCCREETEHEEGKENKVKTRPSFHFENTVVVDRYEFVMGMICGSSRFI